AATSIDPGDLELVVLGKETYENYCAACHGVDLQGQPSWRQRKPDGRLPAPPHDDSGHTWHHDDETLFVLTKYGAAKLVGSPVPTDMPTFEGVLSDREIRAVLAFIKSR
ncbi:MAG: cytochrome c, partial [Desulfuromonadales bacterium]|nr:cytochrome c [Desulfuromonadales bacterium]